MRLNQDCVRDVMLYIEDKAVFGKFLFLDEFLEASELSNYEKDTIKYVLAKLDETNYLKSSIQWVNGDIYSFSTGMITWNGHKFLDTIRDNKVWSKTKSITKDFASVSISLIENIGSKVIAEMILNQMGNP
ncbi:MULTISPECIES: DUF2513 domain-containing protein [Companilactobacillus]|jgi:hypothetical protein|uniref:DUF2513 domain-containing protein n=2 Tax=Companilactobacillus TaxID=2767879 RepID=A0ABW9P3W2_9LACO|nr:MULTISPECIES: DUF2513 domain-containing protein [Companilactobacillus]AKP66320.1 hypothetical protein ABM34_01305 [Companilactobacillus ginsenosidimutans]MCH4008112.1 DUF2513 domain-containing protein [Companilactobacillus sp.]MCH4051709.1 DUF2513 domain-containing protein [Companilactobacillus sp.]MCH4076055.1 DUF2513 domain-containing protein [Companilactobacillus sp.]MCH4124630.1 DUF2513 domain-containing protein [Companilactobacillus sp.]